MTETTSDDIVWYLARDGKQHGPLTAVEMSKLRELGHLRATDLVWRPGFTDWKPAPTVFDLSPPAPPAPKPPPPEPVMAETSPSASAPAARPQPSFAGMSAKPAATSPARFDFSPRPEPVAETVHTEPTPREPQPASFDATPFRPANTSSQFGTPADSTEPAPEPFRMEPMFDEAKPVKQGRGVGVALGLLLVVGGLSAAGYVYRDTIKSAIQGAGAKQSELPVVQAPPPAATPAAPEPPPAAATAPSPEATPVVVTATPDAQTPPAAAPSAVTNAAATPDANPIEAALQPSPFWSYAKTEFPQWYADRMREVAEMKASNQPDSAIDRKLVEAIVVMRRQNASKALAASPARLKDIAETFVANLGALQTQSVDACYEFIEKGEMTPAAAALVQKPVEGAPLHAQLRAVFAAVVEGQQSPVARAAPQATDYNLLAAELGTIGWSQADIQLFADPKALAAAPRDRVCKMVKDWFTAHLAVKDEPARERLLHETLRLVIAS